MPAVLVGLPAIFTALGAVVLALTLTVLTLWLLRALADHVPVIGGYIADAARSVRNEVVGQARRWAERVSNPLGRFLSGVAVVGEQFAGRVLLLANRIDDALTILRRTTLPNVARAIVRPVAATAAFALGMAETLQVSLRFWVGRFRAEVAGLWGYIRRELVPDLRWVITVAIPRLSDRIAAQAARFRAVVIEDVLPRLGSLEIDLGRLGRLVDRIRGELSNLGAYVGPLAAAFAVSTVIDLLRHVRECRPATTRLCRTDLDFLDDLLGLLFIGLTLDELVALVEESVPLAEEVENLLAELVER